MTTATDAFRISRTVPARSDAAYLDFVAGLRLFNDRAMVATTKAAYEARAAVQEQQTGRRPTTLAEAKQLLEHDESARWYKYVCRISQEMNWHGVIRAIEPYAPLLERALDEAEQLGPGSLRYDPEFQYPEYFDRVDFHLQPGSYHRFPLSGYIYYYGTRVYHLGRGTGDPDERKAAQVVHARVPADGQVRRILEIACSAGQGAAGWKQRYPEAEVWAIDIAAPMVRFAHRLAVERGLDINFVQMAGEDLQFPDNYFDVVQIATLFHETPVAISERVVREAYRVLRPGGTVAIFDMGNASEWTPFEAWLHEYDTTDNNEPYEMEFCEWDLEGAMAAAGFRNIEKKPAILEWRTAEK